MFVYHYGDVITPSSSSFQLVLVSEASLLSSLSRFHFIIFINLRIGGCSEMLTQTHVQIITTHTPLIFIYNSLIKCSLNERVTLDIYLVNSILIRHNFLSQARVECHSAAEFNSVAECLLDIFF